MPTYATTHEDSYTRTRSRSPSMETQPKRKRRRKVFSCYDCRKRKLQCDRATPACGRCVQSGQASECTYIDDSSAFAAREAQEQRAASRLPGTSLTLSKSHGLHASEASRRPASGADMRSWKEYHHERFCKLVTAVEQRDKAATLQDTAEDTPMLKNCLCPPSPDSELDPEDGSSLPPDGKEVTVRSSAFKSQFHGPTHPGALIPYIPALHQFSLETLREFPTLGRVRQELRRFEDPAKEHDIRPVSDAELRGLVPPKSEVDRLVQLYFNSFGTIYHVLHTPSFWRDYEAFWTDNLSASTHFVAIVLLVTAASRCLTEEEPWLYSSNSSLAREKAEGAIVAVENWLMRQSQKHVTAAAFQVRVLLIVAKQASARKPKRSWTQIGTLLRFCMSAGMHRNPDVIQKPTSLLERELRTRVWAAVTELELQTSFDRGMVSAPWLTQSDCPAPSNITDDELDTDRAFDRPLGPTHFTRTSYLSIATRSIEVRIEINAYLNNIRRPMEFDDVKMYTEELERQLSQIPKWTDKTADLPRAMLSLTLRQYILVLNERFLHRARAGIERDFSSISVIEQSKEIIQVHHDLTSNGKHALELLRVDQLRAALAICHVASVADPRMNSGLRLVIDEAAEIFVPRAIEMLTDKVIRFGREQRQLWILLVASAFMKCKKNPSERRLHMQQSVDMLTRPYYKIVACQQSIPSPTVESLGDLHTPKDPQESGTTSKAPGVDVLDPMMGTNSVELDEMAMWTIQDWAFEPQILADQFDSRYWLE